MIRAHTLRWQLTTAAILFTLSFLHLTADKHEPLLSMTVPPNELDIQIPASALVDETVTIEINYTGVSQVDVTLNFGDGSPSEIVTLAGNGTIPNGTLPNATTTITHVFTAAGLYTVTGSIDTTSSDSAVIEILAPTPEATPEATQTPGVDDTPGPQDTDTPEPEETKTLSPEDTATPKPEETPDPAMTETPKPTGTITPKPEESDTPTSEPSKTPMTPVDGNHKPVAVNDNVSTKKGEAIKIAVLGNDTDIDEDELSIESVTSPQNGDATNNATFVIYTPDDGFVGSDKLSYVVADGNGGSDTGQVFVNVLEQVESAICEPDQETTIEVNDDVETDDDFRQSYSIAVSILIESGSVSQETRINYGRVQSEQRTEADFDEERLSGFKFTAFAFMLEALVDEFIQTNFRFNKPIRISITYEEIAINGLDESTLTFVYYHTAEDRWSDSGINVVERNTETNTLTIEVDHLTEFALVAQESPTSLETTDEPTGRPDSMFLPFVLP